MKQQYANSNRREAALHDAQLRTKKFLNSMGSPTNKNGWNLNFMTLL